MLVTLRGVKVEIIYGCFYIIKACVWKIADRFVCLFVSLFLLIVYLFIYSFIFCVFFFVLVL